MCDMATESNKMTQDMENKDTDSLTDRQIKVLPYIVASSTYSEGCRKAKVSRKTFYLDVGLAYGSAHKPGLSICLEIRIPCGGAERKSNPHRFV
jgi:hypothetical protein